MKSQKIEKKSLHESVNDLFLDIDIMSITGYLSVIRSGVSGKNLREITKLMDEKELIARTIGKDASNLSKSYRVKHLNLIDSDNLIATLRVYIQAEKTYESFDLAKEWMHSPIPTFGGEIPVNILDSNAGRELVRQTLRKMESGEYV